jgi:hypothetical protein
MIKTIHLQLLLATFAGWVTRQQSHVIAYLIEENRVLKEQLESGGRRLCFTDDQYHDEPSRDGLGKLLINEERSPNRASGRCEHVLFR